ncbi:glutathione S-transferase family protein [Burkholderia gladioli]|uniref:glutathione S-transferase family protein n=1 Tax=Burkholderia gladioli TaxID=28095 RepID=UPI00163FB8F6|nr:glutathione S-transferase family protein [Burkholderia gladioli]
MKLYDRDGAPNTARIRIVLAAKGLEDQVQYESVDLISAEQKQPDFLTKNPIGKIPLLELDDGFILSESTAITEYLDNLNGNPIFMGKTPRERATVLMMQRRVEQLLLEPLDDFFHYGTPGLGKTLAPWRMPEWDGRKEWGLRRGDMAIKGLAYFDELLKERSYLALETFALPDITLYISLLFAEIAGLPVSPELTTLAAWRAKVDELPYVKNRKAQGILPGDLARLGQ